MHEEIYRFYLTHIRDWEYNQPANYAAALKLLFLLDAHGDCPSITIGDSYEQEAKLTDGGDVIRILSVVPLWKHSLAVAYGVISLARGNDKQRSRGIIAALGHDIGNVPKYYNICNEGTHELVSVGILKAEIAHNLGWWSELEEAILLHHKQFTGNYLHDLLQAADMKARRKEISDYHCQAAHSDSCNTKVGGPVPFGTA